MPMIEIRMTSKTEIDQEEIIQEQSPEEFENSEDENYFCHWCHQIEKDNEQFPIMDLSDENLERKYKYCCPEHEQKIIKFYNYSEKIKLLYYAFIFIIPLILMVLLVIFTNWLFIYLVFVSFGIGLLFYPLLREKTVKGIGLKNTLILGRVLGMVILLIGITLFVINGWTIFRPN